MTTLKEFADHLEAGGRENVRLYLTIIEPIKKVFGMKWLRADPDHARIQAERHRRIKAKRERDRQAHWKQRP